MLHLSTSCCFLSRNPITPWWTAKQLEIDNIMDVMCIRHSVDMSNVIFQNCSFSFDSKIHPPRFWPLLWEPTFDISRGSAGPRGVEMDHDVPVTTAGPTLGADAGERWGASGIAGRRRWRQWKSMEIRYMSQGGFETHSFWVDPHFNASSKFEELCVQPDYILLQDSLYIYIYMTSNLTRPVESKRITDPKLASNHHQLQQIKPYHPFPNTIGSWSPTGCSKHTRYKGDKFGKYKGKMFKMMVTWP